MRIIERILLVFNNIWRGQSIDFGKPFPPVLELKIFFLPLFGSNKLTNRSANAYTMYGAYIIISPLSSFVIWSTRPILMNQKHFSCVCVDCVRAKNDYYIDFEIREIWDCRAKKRVIIRRVSWDVECVCGEEEPKKIIMKKVLHTPPNACKKEKTSKASELEWAPKLMELKVKRAEREREKLQPEVWEKLFVPE